MMRQFLYGKTNTANIPGNTTGYITNLTRDKEAPSVCFLTILRQLLEIKKLADWTAPACKENLVEHVGLR